MPYGSAVSWLASCTDTPPDNDPRYKDGRPALWVKLPAETPAAAAAAPGPASASGSCTAAARSTPASSSNQDTTGPAATGAVRKRKATAGDTEVWAVGPKGWCQPLRTTAAQLCMQCSAGCTLQVLFPASAFNHCYRTCRDTRTACSSATEYTQLAYVCQLAVCCDRCREDAQGAGLAQADTGCLCRTVPQGAWTPGLGVSRSVRAAQHHHVRVRVPRCVRGIRGWSNFRLEGSSCRACAAVGQKRCSGMCSP